MPSTEISAAASSDMENHVDNFEITPLPTEGITAQDETQYNNPNFTKWNGYYKAIPEVKIAVDMRPIWVLGNEIIADPQTEVILDSLVGNGKQTARIIFKNMLTMKRVNGDAYAEIIRDDKTGELLNLKPLDPASIRVIFDRRGIIKRYEQHNKLPSGMKVLEFKPHDIFHLQNKQIADEIHGVSDIEALTSIIDANKESFNDVRLLMHHLVKPILHVVLDTDDDAKIDAFIVKFDAIVNKGENLFTPKDTVDKVEVISVPINSTLNPLPWREHLRTYFYQVVGIPQIILGSSGEFTESTAKIAYLAFEQSVKDEQQEFKDQIWNQLQLRIDLKFPASLQNELISDENKDAGQATDFQPSDTTAGVGR